MTKLKGLLLTEGMHGMISQVEGLAKALDLDFIHEKIELNNFWKLFPPKLTPVLSNVYKKVESSDFDIIISCGRKSVIPSIHLKKNSNKKVINIHIQNPKVNFKNFDFIVAPEHDGITGENVINTKGAIHYLSEQEIQANKGYLDSFIKRDARKIITLIIGGPTKYYDYSTENVKKIIINYAKEFFVENHTVIEDVDKKAYLSALAISEYIVVTCDSSSMISEAALTGKPIYIANIEPKKNDKRIQKFRNLFKELNITRNLGEELEIWNYQKLDETNRVANIIKQKIKS